MPENGEGCLLAVSLPFDLQRQASAINRLAILHPSLWLPCHDSNVKEVDFGDFVTRLKPIAASGSLSESGSQPCSRLLMATVPAADDSAWQSR